MMAFFSCLIPEDYRASGHERLSFGIAPKGRLVKGWFVPMQEVVVKGEIEISIEVVGLGPGEILSVLSRLRLYRGRYKALEAVEMKSNSVEFEGGEVLAVEKRVSGGLFAFPEALVQVEIECL